MRPTIGDILIARAPDDGRGLPAGWTCFAEHPCLMWQTCVDTNPSTVDLIYIVRPHGKEEQA